MQLHINRDDQQYGPYELAQVKEMLAQGNLLPTDYAWHEGATDWMPLSQVPGVIAPGAATIPVEATPVPAVTAEPAAKTQPIADGMAAKKKKIIMIAGISVASVGAVVGALFVFGGNDDKDGGDGGPKKNGGVTSGPSGDPTLPLSAKKTVTYTGDIKPILEGNCYKCHHPNNKVKGELDMSKETGSAGMWESESGKVILPGKSADSLLVKLLRAKNDPMPPDETKKLTNEEVGLIRKWIDQGANFD